MTDETTARDRARELIATKLYDIHGPACTDEDGAEADAHEVVEALLNNPEVLRALAGVPADERYPRPRVAGRCPSCRGASLFLGSGGHVTCSRLDCPAPGAVDDQLHAVSEVDRLLRQALADAEQTADELAAAQAAIQRVREMCKPTGAHLLNKALFARDVLRALDGEPDGMDLEAQGEMSDQLAAAQAALERVRDEVQRMKSDVAAGFPNSVAEYAADLRRALDGDTTEEA